MYEPVIMITGTLEKRNITQSYGCCPIFIRNKGINVSCPYDMQQGKKNETNKSGFWHLILPQVHDKWYQEEYRSYMLQILLMWKNGIDTSDNYHHSKYKQ